MNKAYLSRIFILAILAVGGFFAVSKFINTENISPVVMDEPKMEEQKTENSESVSPPYEVGEPQARLEGGGLPPPPALGRPINVTTSISGLEKDEAIEQIKHFEASLINKPENLHEWVQLGNLRKVIGDYFGAVEYWKYASVLMPNYHVPYNNLGNLYQYYLNDIAKAEWHYKKYIELSPQTEEPYKLLFDLYTTSYKEKENLAQGVLEEGIKNTTHNNYLKTLLENYKKEKGIEQ